VAELPGAGAAGGTGAMLLALGASIRSGVEVVLEALRFADRLNGADLVITGEGRLDRQTLGGKAPVGVVRSAAEAGVPCAALVGATEIEAADAGFVAVRSLVDHFGDPATAMARAEKGLSTLAAALVRSFASAKMRP
jgi:glycerate kinase